MANGLAVPGYEQSIHLYMPILQSFMYGSDWCTYLSIIYVFRVQAVGRAYPRGRAAQEGGVRLHQPVPPGPGLQQPAPRHRGGRDGAR